MNKPKSFHQSCFCNHYADLTITTDKLKQLFEPLVDPEKVGEELGLPQSERKKIQNNYNIPTQRQEAYLDIYVHKHPCPSWSEIAMLLDRILKLDKQAEFVRNTYVEGMLFIRVVCVSLCCE